MQISIEISLYPLNKNFISSIDNFISRLKIYDSIKVNHRIQKSEQKRKAEERRAKSKASAGGGKTYTHSVKG